MMLGEQPPMELLPTSHETPKTKGKTSSVTRDLCSNQCQARNWVKNVFSRPLTLHAREPAPKTRTQGLSRTGSLSTSPGRCGRRGPGSTVAGRGLFTDTAPWPQPADGRAWRHAGHRPPCILHLSNAQWCRRRSISISRCQYIKKLPVIRNKARKVAPRSMSQRSDKAFER